MHITRTLKLDKLLKNKSFFLFEPRATGKSTLIRDQLGQSALIIDLLRADTYLHLSARPQDLKGIIAAGCQANKPAPIVVIDEIQKIPLLLDEVHRLIEERQIRFLLTGSSARKLKQAGTNLLAGRAWVAELFSLTYREISDFDLATYLRYGALPPVHTSSDPEEELTAYVNLYLQEEIKAEAVVRKLPSFSRFLQLSALTSGQRLNFSNIASDIGTTVNTVREYYHVLEDTFIGFMLPAWTRSIKRKPVSTAKFYYSDIGVKNTLARISKLEPASDIYGHAFEHFIALELRAYLSYRRQHTSLSYWRSQQGMEVDFIIGDDIAIEVKTSSKVNGKHLKGLKALQEEQICQQYWLVSHDPIARVVDGVQAIHWKDFLDKLWDNQIVTT